jgi:radical SAM protein with 4Fe4S-binding SPASM domain
MMYQRIHIEITNICNLQCTFCPEVLRPKAIMELDPYEYILKQAAPLTKQVCLHLMGEPLLHPQLDDIFKTTEKYQAKLNLTSNGVLLDKKLPEILNTDCIEQLNFSLQSFKDNFPKKDFKQYFQKILIGVDQILRQRPEMYINLRLWNSGTEMIENEDVFSMLEHHFNLQINRQVDVSSIKSKKIVGRLYLHFDSRFDWPAFDYPDQGKLGFCYGLKTHFGIHANGEVVPCCLDKEAQMSLGNIFQAPLAEILNGDRATSIVQGFERGERVEKLCQHCSFIQRFENKAQRLARQNS